MTDVDPFALKQLLMLGLACTPDVALSFWILIICRIGVMLSTEMGVDRLADTTVGRLSWAEALGTNPSLLFLLDSTLSV